MKKTLLVLPLLLATNVFASPATTNLKCEYKGSKIDITIDEGASQINVASNTSILFTIDSTEQYNVADGKAISYKVKDGKDANGFTLSGEIAVLNGNNGEKKAGMRLRNNELAKTVFSTGEMKCK